MLKIQMGHAYFLHDDRTPRERGEPYLSLATGQLATLLRVKRRGVMIAGGRRRPRRFAAIRKGVK